jgi:hypothetical protein
MHNTPTDNETFRRAWDATNARWKAQQTQPPKPQPMTNNPDTYTEAGRKAAQARNQRDEARASSWADYFRKTRDTEATQEGRDEARRLYQAAYTEARSI